MVKLKRRIGVDAQRGSVNQKSILVGMKKLPKISITGFSDGFYIAENNIINSLQIIVK